MKITKIIAVALLLTVGAAATTASAKKKKADKVEEKAQPAAVVELKSGSDSLSYASGYANTQGLLPYLEHEYKVDTVYMADFIQGFTEAKDKMDDPRYRAAFAGASIAKLVSERMLTPMSNELKGCPDTLNVDAFYAGFVAALLKDTTKYNVEAAGKFMQERMQKNMDIKKEQQQAAGKAWLAENAKKEGVITTPSGLQYKVITMGTGAKPQATDEVSVKYEGHLIDGTEFDSSYKRPDPITKFKANQVIKGWTEALTMMPVGSKWELYIPQDLAYGAQAQGQIPAYSTLIFTVELVDITK